MPSATPGGTAAEEDPDKGQCPDGDDNRIFAGCDHARPWKPTLISGRPFMVSMLLRQPISDTSKLDIRRISRAWR